MVLHHVPDTGGILRQFHALLGPGGWLAICDLDKEDGTFHDPDFDGHKGFNRAALGQQMEKTGFTEVRAVTAFEVTRDSAECRKVYPLFLLVGRKPLGGARR
jgi:2-polyprenyl-3-methyl-5-hydroxy-6-metoxy-1,4-benzoquinol methylase